MLVENGVLVCNGGGGGGGDAARLVLQIWVALSWMVHGDRIYCDQACL